MEDKSGSKSKPQHEMIFKEMIDGVLTITEELFHKKPNGLVSIKYYEKKGENKKKIVVIRTEKELIVKKDGKEEKFEPSELAEKVKKIKELKFAIPFLSITGGKKKTKSKKISKSKKTSKSKKESKSKKLKMIKKLC